MSVGQASIRVRYADTDQMGVVYYSNYFVWFEIGRTEWFRETAWSYLKIETAGIVLPVIEAFCKYHKPARYDEKLTVHTSANLISPARLRFDYKIMRNSDDVVTAAGHTVHAALDSSGKPRRLPSHIQRILS